MNNKEEEYSFDINQLYDIALRLKSTNEEIKGVKAIISKNPSRSMSERLENAKNSYQKALTDFNYFVDNYIIFERKDEISEIQIHKIIEKINKDVDKVFKEYKKEEN